MRNMRGFSVIEVMVAAAVFAIASYYIVDGVRNTLNDSSNLNDRLLVNQIGQERISKLKNLSGYYLPITDAGGAPGFYAGCYNRRGLLSNKDGAAGEKVVFGKTPGRPSELCANAEMEVQMEVDPHDSALLTTYLITYRNGSRAKYSVHKRQIRLEKAL